MRRFLTAALALLSITVSAQTPPSLRRAATLESELIVATKDDETLKAWTEWRSGTTLDSVTEVRPDMPAQAVVRIAGCQVDYGKCNVNVDYTIYGPDNAVYKEAKQQPVPDGKTAPSLRFTMTTSDKPGLYRVVVTVRDLNARRTQRPERIFSLRID